MLQWIIQQNEHVCRVQLACTSDDEIKEKIDVRDIDKSKFLTKTPSDHLIDHVTIDPGNIISPELKAQFKTLLYKHSQVFSPNLSGYNGAIGPFKASVNMGTVQPPQRKGRMPQYSRDNLNRPSCPTLIRFCTLLRNGNL